MRNKNAGMLLSSILCLPFACGTTRKEGEFYSLNIITEPLDVGFKTGGKNLFIAVSDDLRVTLHLALTFRAFLGFLCEG